MPHSVSTAEFTPDLYPPFPPSSPSLPLAHLETISLRTLLAADSAPAEAEKESQRVLEACKTQGFFYLNLEGCELGETIDRDADEVARAAERFFTGLGVEEKQEFALGGGTLFGYKRVGFTVVDKSATPDTAEFFNIAKDTVLSVPSGSQVPLPPVLSSQQALFARYVTAAHTIGLHLLTDIFRRLGADPSEITSRHDIHQPAGDHIRMTRGPPRDHPDLPEIQTPAHTDFGSITVLMNWLGGLQVWSESSRAAGGAMESDPLPQQRQQQRRREQQLSSPSNENNNAATTTAANPPGQWLWVPPRRHHAIINLGDAAVKFSAGVLCSGRHRVVPAPGEQGLWPRYSIVYFVRPHDACVLKTLRGEGIPGDEEGEEEGINAKEWIFRQSERLRLAR